MKETQMDRVSGRARKYRFSLVGVSYEVLISAAGLATTMALFCRTDRGCGTVLDFWISLHNYMNVLHEVLAMCVYQTS